MLRCKLCWMPDTRPGSKFDSEGICQACRNYERRKTVDWEQRWNELETLCGKYRREDGYYDCIVPVSGGKDSHYQVYVMKERLGMNPLLLTVGTPFSWTQAGWHNFKNIGDVFGCDHYLFNMSADMLRRAMMDLFQQSPDVEDFKGLHSFFNGLVEKYAVDYVYPSTDAEIGFLNRHRDEFGNAVVVINKPFIINTFCDKYKAVEFLRVNGLPYPRTFLIDEFNGQLDYPFLIKARRKWGGKGLIEVRDSDEFEFYRTRVSDAVVQEILGTVDDEYTVGVFCDGTSVYSICFRRYLGYGSLSKFVELVPSDETHGIVERLARKCGLVGSLNVQLRKTDRGYVPFEVNARISGSVYFGHCFGFKDVKWWLDIKQGRRIEYKPKYRRGIGVRTVSEMFFEME